jgi:hypothetical protein
VSGLTRANVRAFMSRDWDAVRRVKDESIGRRVRADGATAAFKLAQMLFDQVWERVRHDEARGDVSGLLAYEKKLARARR